MSPLRPPVDLAGLAVTLPAGVASRPSSPPGEWLDDRAATTGAHSAAPRRCSSAQVCISLAVSSQQAGRELESSWRALPGDSSSSPSPLRPVRRWCLDSKEPVVKCSVRCSGLRGICGHQPAPRPFVPYGEDSRKQKLHIFQTFHHKVEEQRAIHCS